MKPFCYLLLGLIFFGSTGCQLVGEGQPAPLATWDPDDTESFASSTVGNGTLEFSESCVRLVLDNQKTILLVWPEPTSWNATAQTIEFVDVLGNQIELQEGDQIIPGGSTVVGESAFVNPPNPSCTADETFIVNSLSVVSD